jgi:2-polyprenyl-6-methoxyphenol hydroxylase-like FAD-dependent oxidoreductase
VKHGVEVVGLLKERERVAGVRARIAGHTTECEIEARWTIGDDGGNSTVRKECGIGISVSTLPVDLLSFGFKWPTFLQPDEARAWINLDRVRSGLFLMAALPRPAGIGAGLIAARPRLFKNDGAVRSALDAFCAADPGAAEVIASRRYPDDLVRVKIRFGHADRYGVDGAVLIGDAAHTVTPAGGQGANSAIADARLLANDARHRILGHSCLRTCQKAGQYPRVAPINSCVLDDVVARLRAGAANPVRVSVFEFVSWIVRAWLAFFFDGVC